MKLFEKIFKSSKTVPADLTMITRTEVIEGFSIPGIIHNMQYHFTDLQVYSDGLISCWEMVDLSLFKDKLNEDWVVTSIPDGEAISIFSLGHWNIEQGEWKHTKETLYNYVYSLVKQLNPKLENLHNYQGDSSKMVGKAKVAKHILPTPQPYYFDEPKSFFSKRINGEKFHFFYRNEDNKTYLAELSIYKSGNIEITNLPKKKIYKFEDLDMLIENETLRTDLKIGEIVTILNLGSFKVVSGSGVDIKFKMNELTDKFNELNGRENSINKCVRIFDEYKQNPTKKLRDELKFAYEAVPKHQRIFVGTMDTKDYEVRQVIYGDIVKKEWEDDYGYEYPYDDMPKPCDK
ncbi:hypothetical protein [Sphingobacterium sp. JUb56]|uniref:DUF7638 domain-containing protein n=1 Tax=Sphingobacterium sp. JUb56 TaxID=2587145 RepID=UPI00160AED93|nr:hypothetical protein [Sphingobacterium sp. JUb56]MBB2950089.1 hypothetical protein [Sphingobacterium sp. JUb56]